MRVHILLYFGFYMQRLPVFAHHIYIYHYPFELLVPLNSNITTFQILACVMFFLNRIILVFTLLVTELKHAFEIFLQKIHTF
jgi:hypothetical protein